MEYNNELRPRKRRRKNNSAVIFILFTVCFFAMALCVFLLFSYNKQRQETAQAMLDLGTMEAAQAQMYTKEQADGLVEAGKQEILDKIKSMVQEGEGILDLLQYFFPDEVIVSGYGKYHFFPISDELAHNDFDLTKFTYPEYNEEEAQWEGTADYRFPDGTKARKGVDVSTFQGDVDWKKVKADGMEYALIRLGFRGYESGKIVLDSKYEDNIKGSLAAGIDTGVYFFTEALTEKEAVEEADFVIENLEGYKINMPVVIDVEESASPEKTRTKDLTPEQRTKNVIAFCERIKEAGYDVMVYGNLKSFMLMMNIEELEDYDKWFAYYRYPFHFPYKIKMWQYTSSEKVDGISGKADVNLMFY